MERGISSKEQLILSVILSQDDHPFVYLSRNIFNIEKKLSDFLERRGIREFLLGRKFLLKSDPINHWSSFSTLEKNGQE